MKRGEEPAPINGTRVNGSFRVRRVHRGNDALAAAHLDQAVVRECELHLVTESMTLRVAARTD